MCAIKIMDCPPQTTDRSTEEVKSEKESFGFGVKDKSDDSGPLTPRKQATRQSLPRAILFVAVTFAV